MPCMPRQPCLLAFPSSAAAPGAASTRPRCEETLRQIASVLPRSLDVAIASRTLAKPCSGAVPAAGREEAKPLAALWVKPHAAWANAQQKSQQQAACPRLMHAAWTSRTLAKLYKGAVPLDGRASESRGPERLTPFRTVSSSVGQGLPRQPSVEGSHVQTFEEVLAISLQTI